MIPLDLENLLAVTIRDLLWYKDNVYSFFDKMEIPKSLLIEIRKQQREKIPTIKSVHFIIRELSLKGDEGNLAMKKIFTNIYRWNDFQSINPERKELALEHLRNLRLAYDTFLKQKEYQEEQETKMHQERLQRINPKILDHSILQGFRDKFDQVFVMKNPQERGNQFEELMNKIFSFYCDKSQGPFKRDGEQVDGLFYFDSHWYYVEIRWKKDQTNAADISVLRDRAVHAYGGDTKALFISFNGFTSECITSLEKSSDERVMLMDGSDLRMVLDCQIGLDVLLTQKQIELVKNKKPYVSAKEILSNTNNV